MSTLPTYADWARLLEPVYIVGNCSPTHILQTIEQARSAILNLQAERDELLAVAIAYQEVRKLQAAYFKARTQENLIASKQAEKALDAQARAATEKATA